MPADLISLDLVLHVAGLAFLMGIWFAAILGIAEICRALRPLVGRKDRPIPATTVEAARSDDRAIPAPLLMPTLASR